MKPRLYGHMPGFRPMACLLSMLALLVAYGGVAIPPQTSFATTGPAFRISAPQRISAGEPFTIKLSVQRATDIGGFESAVLFDSSVAEFQGYDPHDTDLRQSFGRDALPIIVVDVPYGAAIALYSCPVSSCVAQEGPYRRNGGRGTVSLGAVGMVANEPGWLEVVFDPTRIVDSQGEPVALESSRVSTWIRVDPTRPNREVSYPAPAPAWQLPAPKAADTPQTDLAPDGTVSHVDIMEVALDWQSLRESNGPCGLLNGVSVDVNRDGCIDIADLQTVAGDYSDPENPEEDPSGRSPAAAGLVLTVNSTGDEVDAALGNGVCATSSGTCTLRAAIQEANNHAGRPDEIRFNIPGTGVHTIQLGSRLPTVWGGDITIDGYTQPGAFPNTDPLISNASIRIEVRGMGMSAFDGLPITSASNTVRGLAFYNLGRAIWIDGSSADENVIVGNFIGTNASGTFGYGSSTPHAHGIHIEHGSGRNRIGGTSSADRNVISGNGRHGVGLWHGGSNANVVYNNLVGLTPSGNVCRANRANGIDINYGSSFNVVGGTGPGERNVATGNSNVGLDISHSTAPTTTGNKLIGNYAGTGVNGRTMPSGCNNKKGIRLKDGVQGNLVSENVVGFNTEFGIQIEDYYTSGNTISNNRIGEAADETPIPNAKGVEIEGSGNTLGPGNVIAHNNGMGVNLVHSDGDFNTITRNSIYSNAFLGINLLPNGVNANDPGDADSGPNEQLNFPVIASATTSQASGTACSGCTVEVFIADGDPSDHGEGKQFIGSGVANGAGNFAVAISGVSVGQRITSTATDAAGNTSEFSRNGLVSGSTSVPAAPTNLTATAPSGYQIELKWTDNATNESGYVVERSLNQSNWEQVASNLPIDSKSFIDANLIPGTTYYYRVAAVNSAGTSGYSNVAQATTKRISFPGRLEVEDYKLGGEGVGYHDTTSGNAAGACRTDDVDLANTSDTGGGCNLGFVITGEWLAYDIEVATSGTYTFTSRVATVNSGRRFHIEVDGVDVTGAIQVSNTGGWQTWSNVTTSGVNLTAGVHELRIVMDTGDFNLNYIEAASTSSSNIQPVASFTYACSGLTCDFTDTSTDSDGTIVGWGWDFGEGSTSTDQHPSHTFGAADTYTVELTATDDGGSTDVASTDITVQQTDSPPVADDVTEETGEDEQATLTLSGSDQETCELVFGIVDGPANGSLGSITESACTSGTPNSDSATVVYTPTAGFSGTDSFTYRVNDGTQDSPLATATITVNAGNAPPAASFTYSCADLTCDFTDTSSDNDGSIVTWDWDFGDGSTSTEQHSSHTFASANTYAVTLTVTDDDSDTDTGSQPVTVEEADLISLPGRLEVEDYKVGGEGVGYHDTTSGNAGGACRTDDVDLPNTNDVGGGCNLGYVVAGEWLAYDVDVATSGTYTFTARVATIYSGRSFHIEVDGVDVTGAIQMPNTGGWQTWTDVTTSGVSLSAGAHELRIVMDTSNFNLNYIEATLS